MQQSNYSTTKRISIKAAIKAAAEFKQSHAVTSEKAKYMFSFYLKN